MIRDTISEIEAKLKDAGSLSAEAKRELSELLAKLKAEVTDLARTDADQARSIAPATGADREPDLDDASQPRDLSIALQVRIAKAIPRNARRLTNSSCRLLRPGLGISKLRFRAIVRYAVQSRIRPEDR
jgi:hypothetical protein